MCTMYNGTELRAPEMEFESRPLWETVYIGHLLSRPGTAAAGLRLSSLTEIAHQHELGSRMYLSLKLYSLQCVGSQPM